VLWDVPGQSLLVPNPLQLLVTKISAQVSVILVLPIYLQITLGFIICYNLKSLSFSFIVTFGGIGV
jgi:hypothetical protein